MSVWRTLLETAIHAPSPHNVQPWRLRILSNQNAELLIQKNRTLPKEDHTGSFIILTMGLFIEALRILAANRSLQLDYEFCQAPSQFTPEKIALAANELLPFAHLTLGPSPAVDQPFEDNSLFVTRRTSRLSFLQKPIPTDAVFALSQLALKWGQRYEQINDPKTIERIVGRNMEALFEDLNSSAYHDEIVEWFRFTDRSSRRTRDGLDYRCMNASRPSFWLAANLPQLLIFQPTGSLLRRIYRQQLGHVPSIGLLSGPFWEPESAFETGRFLMHFWLELARRDLYIHPYGNLVTNRPAAAWCEETIGVSNIWLIFKIGFSEVPPQSYRRSVEEVLVV